MIEKIFQESIPAETIRSRARYMKRKDEKSTPPGEITTPTVTQLNSLDIPDNQVGHGGIRRGAGRRPKYAESKEASKPKKTSRKKETSEPYTDAVHFALIALSQLERIALPSRTSRCSLMPGRNSAPSMSGGGVER